LASLRWRTRTTVESVSVGGHQPTPCGISPVTVRGGHRGQAQRARAGGDLHHPYPDDLVTETVRATAVGFPYRDLVTTGHPGFDLSAAEVVALSIEELAVQVLYDAQANGVWNWRNWVLAARQHRFPGEGAAIPASLTRPIHTSAIVWLQGGHHGGESNASARTQTSGIG
jgi:hypothetical protein